MVRKINKDTDKYFSTPYNRPLTLLEKGGGSTKVERAGYVPTKLLVEMLVRAGELHNKLRAEQFDGDLTQAGLEQTLTRVKGFDLADASMAKRRLDERMALREVAVSKGDSGGPAENHKSLVDESIGKGLEESSKETGKAKDELSKELSE